MVEADVPANTGGEFQNVDEQVPAVVMNDAVKEYEPTLED